MVAYYPGGDKLKNSGHFESYRITGLLYLCNLQVIKNMIEWSMSDEFSETHKSPVASLM